jgi:hypothetical protein
VRAVVTGGLFLLRERAQPGYPPGLPARAARAAPSARRRHPWPGHLMR